MYTKIDSFSQQVEVTDACDVISQRPYSNQNTVSRFTTVILSGLFTVDGIQIS